MNDSYHVSLQKHLEKHQTEKFGSDPKHMKVNGSLFFVSNGIRVMKFEKETLKVIGQVQTSVLVHFSGTKSRGTSLCCCYLSLGNCSAYMLWHAENCPG